MKSDNKDLSKITYYQMKYVLNEVCDAWLSRSKTSLRRIPKGLESPISCETWLQQLTRFVETYFKSHVDADLTEHKHLVCKTLNPTFEAADAQSNSLIEAYLNQGLSREDILSEVVELFAALAMQMVDEEPENEQASLVYQLSEESTGRTIEVSIKRK